MVKRQHLEIHACWVDEEPCAPLARLMPEVITLLEKEVRDDKVLPEAERIQQESIQRSLPCIRCPRHLTAAAQKLSGTRLGATERRLLLTLPGPDDPTEVVAAEGTRAARESAKRAVRKLLDLGLVETSQRATERRVSSIASQHPGTTFERTYHLAAAALSPWGAALVSRIRPDLEAGERLRWGLVPTATAEATQETLEQLIKRIVQGAEGVASRLTELGVADRAQPIAELMRRASDRIRQAPRRGSSPRKRGRA